MAGAAVVASSMVLIAHAQDDIGYDPVSMNLNNMIYPSDDIWSCLYCAGKGVIVRSPDGFENDQNKNVVPGTFWTNDLYAPSQLYPMGDPGCPSAVPGMCENDKYGNVAGPWNDVQMAMVVGSAMDKLFPDFDNIQASDWGWGVFYPTDSNACDGRCRWRGSDNAYDCPGGWFPWQGDFEYKDIFFGAGHYSFGNPYGGGGGGGAGCHFNFQGGSGGAAVIDQTNGDDGAGTSLVGNQDCECNYDLIDGPNGARDWVDHFIQHGGYMGPSSSMDVGACWVNNPRDMIKLQNEIFWRREEWNDGSVPWARWDDSPQAQRVYWGWNEVPVDRVAVNDPQNWDAVVLKLPAELGGGGVQDRMSMLSWDQGDWLEGAMYNYITTNMVIPGSDNVRKRPGSYAVIVREWRDGSGNYQREFFCETWDSPNGYFRILYYSDQACYVEWGTTGALGSPPKSVLLRNSTRGASGSSSAISV